MAYRDESVAARARLVALEHELYERREAGPQLSKYTRALRDERDRLRHAVVWYRNGERYGHFHATRARDDLARAEEPKATLPGLRELERALAGRDALELAARERQVTYALTALEPGLWRARVEIDRLRAECCELRTEVEAFAVRYPQNPPPPEWNPLWARAIVVGAFGVAAVLVTWVTALLALALAG
jgi:hypothetical protein